MTIPEYDRGSLSRNSVSILNRVKGSLLGVMLGDALGQPVETMSADEILRATNGIGIQAFIAPLQTKISDTRNLRAGDYTDDWQLTAAVGEALIQGSGEYRQDLMILHHKRAGLKSTSGWGKTTRLGIEKLIQFGSGFAPGYAPTSQSFGRGNGIAMKVAPIPLMLLLRDAGESSLLAEVQQLAWLTPHDSQVMLAAYAFALMLMRIGESGEHFLLSSFENVINQIEEVSSYYACPSTPSLLTQLKKLQPLIGNVERIGKEIPPSFLAVNSVVSALGIFLSEPRDFSKAVLTAVNAGGDTDSTAAMVGALVGATQGVGAIPAEWKEFRKEQFRQPLELADRMLKAAR